MVIDMLEGTVMIIEMITGIEIIDDEVVVGVEIGIHVTVTERGIIVAIAGVAATALMVTRSMGGTVCLLHVEVLVVAEVAATVLMITRGVAETAVHHLRVGALAGPHLARHHLLLRDLLSGASAMMTGLHVLGALRHEHCII